ncbi:Uncharacterised protein [Mycobacteroides abscessus subsp. abscessus]|nr:Uncharacterised protein [Mycobacteroides abscessus subsp. abscessus]
MAAEKASRSVSWGQKTVSPMAVSWVHSSVQVDQWARPSRSTRLTSPPVSATTNPDGVRTTEVTWSSIVNDRYSAGPS